jgi:hypothetical protein
VDVIIGDIESPIPDLATLPILTGIVTIINTIPTATDVCVGLIKNYCNPRSYSLPGTYTIVWKYDGDGNSISQNQTVTITSQPYQRLLLCNRFAFNKMQH